MAANDKTAALEPVNVPVAGDDLPAEFILWNMNAMNTFVLIKLTEKY